MRAGVWMGMDRGGGGYKRCDWEGCGMGARVFRGEDGFWFEGMVVKKRIRAYEFNPATSAVCFPRKGVSDCVSYSLDEIAEKCLLSKVSSSYIIYRHKVQSCFCTPSFPAHLPRLVLPDLHRVYNSTQLYNSPTSRDSSSINKCDNYHPRIECISYHCYVVVVLIHVLLFLKLVIGGLLLICLAGNDLSICLTELLLTFYTTD